MPDQLGSFVILLANCTMTRNNMKFNKEGRRRAFHVLTVITKLACEAGSNTRIDTRHTSFFVSNDGQLQFDDAWRAASTATGLGAVRTLLNKYDKEEDERMALGMVNSVAVWAQALL